MHCMYTCFILTEEEIGVIVIDTHLMVSTNCGMASWPPCSERRQAVLACPTLEVGQCSVTQWLRHTHQICTCANTQLRHSLNQTFRHCARLRVWIHKQRSFAAAGSDAVNEVFLKCCAESGCCTDKALSALEVLRLCVGIAALIV